MSSLCLTICKGVVSNLTNSINVMSILDDLHTSLYEVCDEIKEAKLDVVRSALSNISLSRNARTKKEELNKAIFFLENAFSLSLRLLNKKHIEEHTFLFVFHSVDEIPVIPYSYREKWHCGLIDMASLLYLLYKVKDEPVIASKWLNIANKHWEEYVEVYMQLSGSELESINPDYAFSTEVTEYERVELNEFVSKMEEKTHIEYHVTEKGLSYQRDRNKKIIRQFTENLKRMNASFV